jgi:hypothetical protein
MSSNLNEMIVQPTKDAYFQISEKYESDTKGNTIPSQNNLKLLSLQPRSRTEDNKDKESCSLAQAARYFLRKRDAFNFATDARAVFVADFVFSKSISVINAARNKRSNWQKYTTISEHADSRWKSSTPAQVWNAYDNHNE